MTNAEEIARRLSAKQRKIIRDTPHPQPLEGHWFWAGSVQDAIGAAKIGLLDETGFTPLGLEVRKLLEQSHEL